MQSDPVDDEYLEVAAYHEAGHAVVACALSVSISTVQIGVHNGVSDGLTWRELDPTMFSQSDWHYAELKARILLGGEMAERAFDDQAWAFLSETDREQLGDLSQQIPFGTKESRREWLNRMEREAEIIVLENWKEVRALAEALLHRRLLSGAEATQIIRGA